MGSILLLGGGVRDHEMRVHQKEMIDHDREMGASQLLKAVEY